MVRSIGIDAEDIPEMGRLCEDFGCPLVTRAFIEAGVSEPLVSITSEAGGATAIVLAQWFHVRKLPGRRCSQKVPGLSSAGLSEEPSFLHSF